MLSTSYRLKLENICERIANHQEVSLEEMVWVDKLSKHNTVAARFLRQARRKAANPDMKPGGLDDFLNQMDLGGTGHESKGIRRFDSVDDIADFFKRDNPEDWKTRD